MRKILHRMKHHIADSLYHSKILDHVARERFQRKGFVLMYHRVVGDPEANGYPMQPGLYVREHSFERQMCFLNERFRLVPFSEMVDMLLSGRDMSRCCAITFDDGWRDNFTRVFPILKRYGIPATIFLATDYIGTDRWFWTEEVSWYVSHYHDRNMVSELMAHLGLDHYQPDNLLQIDNKLLIHRVIERMKGYTPVERGEVLNRFKASCPERNQSRLLMNWEEARTMRDSGLIFFGSHTAGHVMLDQIGRGEILKELSLSRKHLQDYLGIEASLFAYPNGSLNPMAVSILRESGFSAAVTTKRGYVHKGTLPLEIPRIGIHDDISNTIPLFFSRLTFDAF